MLLITVSSAFAQKNSLSVESPVLVPQGGVGSLAINFEFAEENKFAGYSFDIALPEGFTLKADDYTAGECHVDHSFTINYKEEEGVWSVGCLSLKSELLKGTNGMLIAIPIQVTSEVSIGSKYPAKVQNINFGTKGGTLVPFENDVEFEIEISDKWILDENSSVPPVASGKPVDVKVIRTVKANQWSTIVLPFTMAQAEVQEVFGETASIAVLDTWVVTDYDEETLDVNAVELRFKKPSNVQLKKGFQAGQIYLLKSANAVESFEVGSVEITSTSVEASQVKESGDWESTGYVRGTYVKTKVPAQGLFISNNQFWYSTGKTNIKGFRAWFDLGEVVSASYNTGSGAKITITVDGEATNVDGIPSYQRVVEGVYDLSGRKIKIEGNDLNKLQKGVYIIDGKKVTIK